MYDFSNRDLLIDDLTDYLGITRTYVEKLVNVDSNHAGDSNVISVPNLWRWMYTHREGSEDEHRYFYTICFPYLTELANFAEQFNPSTAGASKFMKGRVLDYGCGIGTVGFYMSQCKSVERVDMVDINPLLTDFAQWRCQRYDLTHRINVVKATDTPSQRREPHMAVKGPYDFIYIRDTLEHCIDRIAIMKRLIGLLNPNGAICEATPIEYYDDDTGHENIPKKSWDIWELLQVSGFEIVSEEPTGGFSTGTTKVWCRRKLS